MATRFLNLFAVQKPIKSPIVRHEQSIAHLTELTKSGILPIPVPDYASFKQPTVVKRNTSAHSYRGVLNPRGISIEPTTEYIYVTDSKNMRIQILSHTGESIKQFGHEHLNKPWGILIHQDNVYVTDVILHAIIGFRLPDLKMTKRVGKRGSGSEEFKCPRQLAIAPNQHIYVTDQYNDRLQILTKDLEFNDSIKHQAMTEPCDIKFSNNEIFVLSYKDKPSIHVFTLSGDRSRSILSRGYSMFFCLDGHNNIVISDFFGRHINVFSPEGQLLHKVGQREEEAGELIYPFGMTIHNNREVICVSGSINFCLQIFS